MDFDGFPAAGRIVRAYRLDTGAFIGETRTAPGSESGTLVCHLPVNGLLDSSAIVDGAGGTWSVTGSAIKMTLDRWKFGGSSVFCDLTFSNYYEKTGAAGWAFGTGDFNIQFFCRAISMPSGAFYSPLGNWASNSGFCFFLQPSGIVSFFLNNQSIASAASAFSINTDYIVDIRRVSGTVEMRLNGTLVASGSMTTDVTRNDFVRLGSNGVLSDVWAGWIGNVRACSGGVLSENNPTSAGHVHGLGAGHYEIWTPYTGEVIVICQDDAAGTVYNHQILRTTPV